MPKRETSKKKSPPKRPNRRITTIWLVLMSLFFAELFCYTWCRVQCVRIGYELSQAAQAHQQLVRLQKKLTIEIARLKSPARIKNIAEQKLGLIMPQRNQMIIIP